MTPLRFEKLDTLLCLGAHSDDIEIGAGATVLRLVREYPDMRVVWVVCSATSQRRAEAEASAKAFLENAAQTKIIIHDLPDSHFPSVRQDVKKVFETLKTENPDLILTHYRHDLHQDHRTVSEATWNTFRNHPILEYEIPKWDGDLGSPNFYVPACLSDADKKIATLLQHFPSQSSKHWFDDLTFRGLMRLRGLECNANDHLAEGFYAKKLSL